MRIWQDADLKVKTKNVQKNADSMNTVLEIQTERKTRKMAERRMFAKTIIDSDAFLDMPMSARLLYYDLSMRADDDGFNNAPNKVARMIGATKDDLNLLILKKFIIPFENGVVVIKHWRIHNYIRKDTYNETKYKEQKSLLELDENKAYRIASDVCQLSVDEPSTQVRLGKDSIDKDIDNNSASDNAPSKKDISEFFEKIWLLYPNKKGKGQVSDSKKKTLFNIGIEEITRAIERYKRDLSKEDWRKPQNGSTFFNSGYVDYLDANYSELIVKPTRGGRANGYNQAPQRQYEMDALERMLLEQENYKPETDPEFLAEAEALKRELQEKY